MQERKTGNVSGFRFYTSSDSFLTKSELNKPETYYPLKVYICKDCSYIQLGYDVPGKILFCRNYPYDNSTSTSFRKHFFDMSKKVSEKFKLDQNSLGPLYQTNSWDTLVPIDQFEIWLNDTRKIACRKLVLYLMRHTTTLNSGNHCPQLLRDWCERIGISRIDSFVRWFTAQTCPTYLSRFST